MPRKPSLRRHMGQWYTQSGSRGGTYFGRLDEVSYDEAKRRFGEFLASQQDHRVQAQVSDLTVAQLCSAHLVFVERERSDLLFRQRKSILNHFCEHQVSLWNEARLPGHGERIADLKAQIIKRGHVEQYLGHRSVTPSKQTKRPLGDKAIRAIIVALKACWNWAANDVEDSGGGLLDPDLRPLAKIPRGYVKPKDLTEADLPTEDEIEIIHQWAPFDISQLPAGKGKWRKRTHEEAVGNPQWMVFADIIKAYECTGARTSELLDAQVRDFMPRTRQICLGKHKRVRTQHNPTVRNIQLDDECFDLLLRNAQGKSSGDPLFSQADRSKWLQVDVNKRLKRIRDYANENGQLIRSHITPYSFRDLYISELLMIDTPPFQVAKMAGTSLREIERTYGHFFNRDLATAQKKLSKMRRKRKKKREKKKRNLEKKE